MVYNTLKLFMEINPDMFDECMQQYKENRMRHVLFDWFNFCRLTHF